MPAGRGVRGQVAALTCRQSPLWMWQRSRTPFSTRVLCRASRAWLFHSQAWTKAAPACTRNGSVK